MKGRRLEFAAAAEGFVGAPFRFRGRDPKTGLDCVGLVAATLSRLGMPVPQIAPYAMRQRHFDAQLASAFAAGFGEVGGAIEPGDLLLLTPGPAQVHLAIVGQSTGLVHAHAGLGRVVLTPPPCPAPIARHWRLRED
jgi:cell wall-associated NlpC family hydrolase